jgi:Peptidase family M1 domain
VTFVSRQKNTGRGCAILIIIIATLVVCANAAAQILDNPPQPATSAPQAPSTHDGPPLVGGPGVALYQKLAGAALDPKAVYSVRDASLDREDLHITLEDGVIGFLEAVDGRVTGAFFEGTGDILVFPPDQAERGSMALFTGTAVMEEKFTSAYLRFNDDTFAKLQPYLHPAEESKPFLDKWSTPAKTLAESDTLRLMASYLNQPPPTGDRMLRARMQSPKLGVFDVYFDTLSAEQIAMFRFSYGEGGVPFYDVLASFPMRSARRSERSGEAERSLVESLTTLNRLRIHSYVVNAKVDPPQKLSAETTLDVEVRDTGDRLLFFELSRYLKVEKVQAEGRELEFLQNIAIEGSALARRGNDIVAVLLPQTLKADTRFRMTFTYTGDVLSDAGGGLLYVGARGIWYPNRGMVMAGYDLKFRYPSDWTLVATGKRVEQTATNGITSSHWLSERPLPVAGFNLGRYTTVTARSGDVNVDVYATTGVETGLLTPRPGGAAPEHPAPIEKTLDPAQNANRVAQQTAHAIDYFSKEFGPFPYSSLAVAQMPGAYGQAWPGLIYLSSLAYLTRDELFKARVKPGESLLFSEFMTPHETAHQWWGDLVGWKSYRDQWLVEALSNYSAVLSLEKEHPDDCKNFLEYYREHLLHKNAENEENAKAGPVTLGQRLNSSHFPNGFNIVSYGRGTWVLHMLRTLLDDGDKLSKKPGGEEPFLRVLRKMRDKYQGREISTREFQTLVEEELPASVRYEDRASLDWFFDSWVNGSAIPKLELNDVRINRKTATVSASFTILQKEAPDQLVTSIPLYADTPAGLKLVARVFADGAETRLRINVPKDTRKLVMDPYQTILSRP